MKLSVPKMVEIEPVAIRIEVAVRYDEEDIPNDFPFRVGDLWGVTVDIATGRIRGWPPGKAAKVEMKVCDQGCYYLLGANDEELAKLEEEYVPHCLPEHYGDYIEFDIAADGTVAK
jgi:hypothetical protein